MRKKLRVSIYRPAGRNGLKCFEYFFSNCIVLQYLQTIFIIYINLAASCYKVMFFHDKIFLHGSPLKLLLGQRKLFSTTFSIKSSLFTETFGIEFQCRSSLHIQNLSSECRRQVLHVWKGINTQGQLPSTILPLKKVTWRSFGTYLLSLAWKKTNMNWEKVLCIGNLRQSSS